MASLTIQVGALSQSISGNNALAANLLIAYAGSIGAEGTNEEKAQAILAALVKHMKTEGHKWQRDQKISDAMAELQMTIEETGW